MATRSSASEDLFSLPRLSADDAVTLATQLVTTARAIRDEILAAAEAHHTKKKADATAPPHPLGDTFPEHIWDSAEDLEREARTLGDAIRDDPGTPAENTNEARAADRVIDRSWRGLEFFMRAWTLVEDKGKPSPAEIHTAYEKVFADGMKFITLRFVREYQESKRRLEIIDGQAIAPVIIALGGDRLLTQLRAAHEDYGRVLGITVAKPVDLPSVDIREPLQHARDALRRYIAMVYGSVRRDRPTTKLLADRLLAPLVYWEEQSRAAAAGQGTKPAPAPATPTTNNNA